MRNKIPKPHPDLTSLLTDSVQQTKNSTPSFNDQQIQQGRQVGWMKANRYLVLIFPNKNVQDGIKMRLVQDTARLATTCKSINMNEQTWYTTEQQDIIAGSSRIFPYRRNTNNTNGVRLQFNCGTDMFEKEFFENWLRYMQNPVTKRWRFYDDYAKGSEMYLLLLPDHVANFNQAAGALFSGATSRITGYRFTEVYPYSINMNGGALHYQTANEPLYMDIGLMYHDMVQLREQPLPMPEAIRPVTNTGFPVIDGAWADQILRDSEQGLSRAVDGHNVNAEKAQQAFGRERQTQARLNERDRSVLESYAVQLQEANLDVPRAVDGLVVQPPPGNGALDLGLTLLSQVQGFFGVGFFGNGFNP
jgi:hypothetical protein